MDNREFTYTKGFTHGAMFHADDVFSTAFLRMLNPDIIIERGLKVPENYDGIVYDIGDGEFDHHSANREMRENGVCYAAFGKLWRAFSHLIVSSNVAKEVDKQFIQFLDESDNTGERNPLSDYIYSLNPFWNESQTDEEMINRFEYAVQIASDILKRIIARFNSIEEAKDYVLSCYKKSINGIVVLNKYAPWQDILRYKKVKVVIYPSIRGGWNAQRIEKSGFEFPKEWYGTREEKIKGLQFCHATGFMCSFDTLENALRAIDFVRGLL